MSTPLYLIFGSHPGEALAPLRGLVAGLIVAYGSTPSLAAPASGAMMVSATVVPVARLQVAEEMPPLEVSAGDIALGYIDAPRALLLRVFSNSRAGFALDVSTLGSWCAGVALQGFDSEVILYGAGGSVVQRWENTGSRSLALRARFSFSAEARPGLYAWPLKLSARAL